MEDSNEEFSGVYYFTNPTKKDRTYLWNNKEYTYPAESRSPLIISNESLENLQEIRKRFAYRMAVERVYEGEITPSGYDYNKAKEMGNGIPPTFDEKILEPFIEECLTQLPIKKATVKQGKDMDSENNYRATKAMGQGDNPSALFAEDNQNIPTLGKMSE